MRKLFALTAVLLLALLLSACGGGAEEASPPAEGGAPSAQAGEKLFAQSVIGSQAGCISCHSLSPDTVIVGPSMAGIGTRAGSTVAGQSAEDYLRQSILEPDAHVVEGYPEGVMPGGWGETLSEEQVQSLVAYLLTLR